MIYALVTATGHEFEFYILSCAELYRDMYGGVINVLEQDHMQDRVDLCDDVALI